jgi:hypothetical protein
LCKHTVARPQVEGRNKALENEVLALRKAAEHAVAEMRTLQNVRGGQGGRRGPQSESVDAAGR